MKLHWGNYIAIFFTCFVVFILFLVFKTFSINTELVSEDYYDKEIAYQQKIDKLSNTQSMHASVKIIQLEDSVQFIFPDKFVDDSIQGTIKMYRPSDISKDLELPIKLSNQKQYCSKTKLSKGNYVVHIDWKGNNVPFYTEESFYIK
jgi:hypothetical protein